MGEWRVDEWVPPGGYDSSVRPPPPPEYFRASPPQPLPRSSDWNGFAIATLALGAIGVLIVPMVLAAIALSQIKKRGQRGKGLVFAGVLLSVLWTLLAAAVMTILVTASPAITPPARAESGEITRAGELSARAVRVGDCINGLRPSDEISTLDGVPCTAPHDGEVLATFELAAGAYPGEAEVANLSEAGCLDHVKSRVDSSPLKDVLRLFTLHPSRTTWNKDRRVACLVTEKNGGTLSGRV